MNFLNRCNKTYFVTIYGLCCIIGLISSVKLSFIIIFICAEEPKYLTIFPISIERKCNVVTRIVLCMWAICSFTSWNDDHSPYEMSTWWAGLMCWSSWTIIYNNLFISIHNVIFISRVKKLTISVTFFHIW